MKILSTCIRLASCLLLTGYAVAGEDAAPSFESEIRPILKAHCWQCHGEDDEQKGGLDSRLARLLIKGGESGPAIKPGDHAESLLFQRVSSGEMPPGAKSLAAGEIALLARWIDAGATTIRPEPESLAREGNFSQEEQNHWSFQPIRRPAIPTVQHADQIRSPIDFFLLARLESEGLQFSEPAERITLIRRLSWNLHGLPPSPEEVDQFLHDQQPAAYARLVDRLLASPAYGERWARHWLDVAGYADSDGVTKQDTVRNWAFKYRDYVIRCFNANKPWDEFLVEQLAGDELITPPYTDLSQMQADRLIATGFLRMSPDGTSGSTTDENGARNQVMAEVIKVVSTSLLGLSVGCAQCHSHRYDPITHTDYYRLRAILEPAYDWKNWRNPAGRLVSQWSAETRQLAEKVDQEVRQLTGQRDEELNRAAEKAVEQRIAQLPEEIREAARKARNTAAENRTDAQKQIIEDHAFLKVNGNSLQEIDGALKNEVLKKWDPQIAEAAGKRPDRDNLMCLTEVPGQIPTTYLFARGDFKLPEDEVLPGELSVLDRSALDISPNDENLPTTGRRLAYARHLTSGQHPLLARVLVNRIWMHHFGSGLVTTPADFGAQGERPSHPRLLDWLAAEFMESGWDLKHLHRVILGSSAYRQRVVRNDQLDALDPDNRLLGRMSMRRLEAEPLRDALLALSGRLYQKMYGPAAPVSLDSVGQRVVVSKNQYDPSGRLLRNVDAVGEDEFRRTIYIQVRRTMPLGVLVPFDPPRLKPNCELRTSSTSAPQALMMMNDPFVVASMKAMAERVRQQAGADPGKQFELAWRLIFSRRPSLADSDRGIQFLQEQSELIRQDAVEGQVPELEALAQLLQALVSSNGFLYVD